MVKKEEEEEEEEERESKKSEKVRRVCMYVCVCECTCMCVCGNMKGGNVCVERGEEREREEGEGRLCGGNTEAPRKMEGPRHARPGRVFVYA